MIQTNYGVIPDELFGNYLTFLIGKFYKILPMFENNDETLHNYLESLQRELIGNTQLISELKYDSNFLTLLNTIEYFIQSDIDQSVYKKEVFKCISIVKKLQEKLKGGV